MSKKAIGQMRVGKYKRSKGEISDQTKSLLHFLSFIKFFFFTTFYFIMKNNINERKKLVEVSRTKTFGSFHI